MKDLPAQTVTFIKDIALKVHVRAFIPLAMSTFLGGESHRQSFFFFFFVLQFSLCLNGFTLNNNYVEEVGAVFSFSFELRAVSGDCVVVLSVSSSS